MTPTERATNLIQRMTRLFERATPGPWILEDGGFIGGPVGYGRVLQTWNKFEEDFQRCDENRSLIVTLRNVGLEGIVGPIRDSLNMLQEFEYLQRSYGEHSLWTTGAGYSLQPRYLEMKAGIEKWCERWEPELDREERKC